MAYSRARSAQIIRRGKGLLETKAWHQAALALILLSFSVRTGRLQNLSPFAVYLNRS